MFTVTIDTKNDAFIQDNVYETINCLNDVISMLLKGYSDNSIHDSNGNNVGKFKLNNK